MAAKAATKSTATTTKTTATKPATAKAKTTLTPDPLPAPVAAKPTPYPQSPVLEMPMAIVVGVVNFFFPGIGTIVAGVVGKHKMIGRGIAQLLLSIIIVGWVWALITSIQCLTNANSAKSATTA